MRELVLKLSPAGLVAAARLGLHGRLDLHLALRWRRHAKQALAIGLSHDEDEDDRLVATRYCVRLWS